MSDFVDRVTVHVKGGDGGNGSAGIRREKYKPLAGPNGGNGSGTVAQGTVKEPTAPLGKTGATVLGLVLMVLALGAGAMVVRSVKAGRR